MRQPCNGLSSQTRPGTLTVDLVVGLSLLLMSLVFVAQTTVWSMGERRRSEVQLQAMEAVANVLESARAVPVEKLETWAAEQNLPADVENQLPRSKLAVRVTHVKDRPLARKVEVELSWSVSEGKPAPPLVLVGFFAPREAKTQGDKP
jgi:hypothetical protein